jgi:hypothetical protein
VEAGALSPLQRVGALRAENGAPGMQHEASLQACIGLVFMVLGSDERWMLAAFDLNAFR